MKLSPTEIEYLPVYLESLAFAIANSRPEMPARQVIAGIRDYERHSEGANPLEVSISEKLLTQIGIYGQDESYAEEYQKQAY